ncbi:MAG: amidohydrolase family protein [Novosphingobium sp.]|nr:amidohydrolase family protein [Novosphingobium sp.]
MTQQFDTVIRGGLIVDGTGAEPTIGDVAIRDGVIVAVGKVDGEGAQEIDATGLAVTPGFIDLHTHYDGQAIWSQRLNPSSGHGVTTVVMGNCGVGFAPCRPSDRDLLVMTMEGVEDIPGVVMAEGLTWDWETFPEFMAALDARKRDIDVAVFAPHSPIRVYAMGDRGANREPASAEDLEKMRDLSREAIAAGAIGVATSRTLIDRRADGEPVPSFDAPTEELVALAQGVREGGGGLVQVLPEFGMNGNPPEADFEIMRSVAQASGLPVTFSIVPGRSDKAKSFWQELMDLVENYNASGEGPKLHPQFAPRPVGMLASFDLTSNPWADCPTYKALAHLPIEERVKELSKPEVKEKILTETPDEAVIPLTALTRNNYHVMFEVTSNPKYEPEPGQSIKDRAEAMGVSPESLAYDLLLQDNGRNYLLVAFGNYPEDTLDHLFRFYDNPDAVMGLGDGGAHYGLIVDSTYPTFVLQHWARDRQGRRLTLAQAVQAMTSQPAAVIGFDDRGVIAPGKKADINVIDHKAIRMDAPRVVSDLPGGGRRLDQQAHGYRYTLVNGEVILKDDQPTGIFPGKVVKGAGAKQGEAAPAESMA